MRGEFFWYLFPSISKVLVGFFMIPFTTYYLDPKDFGIVAILTMISGLIIPLSSTGSAWVLSAHFFKVEKNEKKLMVFNLLFLDIVLKAFWCVFFCVTSPLYLPLIISEYSPEYAYYFQVAVLGILLNGTWATVSYTLVLEKRARTHALLEIGQYVASILAVVICLKYLGLGVISLFLTPLCAGGFVFLAGFWVLRRNISIRISVEWIREIYKVGMLSIPLNLFEVATNTIDRFFIQRWVNLANLGIYSHSRVYQNMFSLGRKAFARSFTPRVLDAYANKKDSLEISQILTLWYAVLAFCGTFVVLFSHEIISFITHGKFAAAAPLVPIWFLLVLSNSFGISYSQYLFFSRQTTFVVKSGIVINSIFMCINAVAIYYFGIYGAVISIVLSNITIQIVRRIYAITIGGIKIAEDKFFIVFIFIIMLYGIIQFITFDIISKFIIFFVISSVIFYAFNLFEELKKMPFIDLLEKLSSSSLVQ